MTWPYSAEAELEVICSKEKIQICRNHQMTLFQKESQWKLSLLHWVFIWLLLQVFQLCHKNKTSKLVLDLYAFTEVGVNLEQIILVLELDSM